MSLLWELMALIFLKNACPDPVWKPVSEDLRPLRRSHEHVLHLRRLRRHSEMVQMRRYIIYVSIYIYIYRERERERYRYREGEIERERERECLIHIIQSTMRVVYTCSKIASDALFTGFQTGSGQTGFCL